jgi:diguanylate cyclase (GGDEF)-like protein
MGMQVLRALSGPRRVLYCLTWIVAVVAGLALIAAAGAVVATEGFPHSRETKPYQAFLMMAVLVVASELRPIVMAKYGGDPVSISQAFAFAALYIWGWAPAVLLIAVAMLIGELVERKRWWKLLFNVGQYALAIFVAGLMLTHGQNLGMGVGTPGMDLKGILWIVLTWIAFHLLNLALVAGLSEEGSWWEDFTYQFWFFTASTMAVLALSPMIAVVATAYDESWWLLPLLMLPLIAVQRTAQMSQEREHRALHDPLTGLPNRLLLADRIETALARSTRGSGRVVVLFLDLDLFKTINDGLGHAVGDDVLVQVSDRLTSVLRPGDTLARFSGDEFAIVCEGIPDYEVEVIAGRIQAALEPPFRFESHEVTVTASIGVATATPYSTAQSLLREADSAMYRA